ncbi:MAG: hypothetical protein NZO16_02720 [Deltaproteobacteria bacterium]|nr:hypothetical protein [Deltaproteobacteria bacterium]
MKAFGIFAVFFCFSKLWTEDSTSFLDLGIFVPVCTEKVNGACLKKQECQLKIRKVFSLFLQKSKNILYEIKLSVKNCFNFAHGEVSQKDPQFTIECVGKREITLKDDVLNIKDSSSEKFKIRLFASPIGTNCFVYDELELSDKYNAYNRFFSLLNSPLGLKFRTDTKQPSKFGTSGLFLRDNLIYNFDRSAVEPHKIFLSKKAIGFIVRVIDSDAFGHLLCDLHSARCLDVPSLNSLFFSPRQTLFLSASIERSSHYPSEQTNGLLIGQITEDKTSIISGTARKLVEDSLANILFRWFTLEHLLGAKSLEYEKIPSAKCSIRKIAWKSESIKFWCEVKFWDYENFVLKNSIQQIKNFIATVAVRKIFSRPSIIVESVKFKVGKKQKKFRIYRIAKTKNFLTQ